MFGVKRLKNLMNKTQSKRILIICPFPEGQAAGQRLKYEQFFDNPDTRVILGDFCHYKTSVSTTCTFATKFKTLKEDSFSVGAFFTIAIPL